MGIGIGIEVADGKEKKFSELELKRKSPELIAVTLVIGNCL